MLLIYDPRTNATRPTSYEELEELTGRSKGALNSAIKRKQKIEKLGGYLSKGMPTLKDRKEWYAKEVFKKEIWMEIEGSEGKYLVSNYGRIKRVCKNFTKFLLPYYHRTNRAFRTQVIFLGEYKGFEVSRLVAHHFIGECPPGEIVRHKNGITTDDFSGNLEYVSRQQNGKMTGPKATSKPVVQLDAKSMKLINEFRSASEASRKLYMSHETVMNNCKGKTKTAVGVYKFMFADEYEELIS